MCIGEDREHCSCKRMEAGEVILLVGVLIDFAWYHGTEI